MSWTFEELACCHEGCGEVIVAHQQVVAKWRRTGEWFYCPAGHRQHFTETVEQKLRRRIAELEERLSRARRDAWEEAGRNWTEMYERERDLARTCPWPSCRDYVYASRSSLYEHMRRAHGMPLLAEVQREAS